MKIFRKLEILLAFCAFLLPTLAGAQGKNIVISGKVTEAGTDFPLPGVQVYMKATMLGTTTDANGEYLISTSDRKGIIVFSMLGYNNVEIPVNEREYIDVKMEISSEYVDEVVVVGYGSQKKASVTGALSQVEPKLLQSKATPSLSNTLGGVMPGIITRQTSGEPGFDQASIVIRGAATWGSTAPLILVDGVERSLNNIAASDIESFTILKDASATAVYGMKGANGVILIKTKKGEKGKPKITLRTEFANLFAIRLPQYINGYQFANLMNEATQNAGGTILPWNEYELERFRLQDDKYLYPSVDWTDLTLKKHAFQSINNLSVTGGNDVVRYYVNIGYTTQSGLFKSDPSYDYRTNTLASRYNFRTNVDVNLSKNFSIELGLSEIVEDRTMPGASVGDIFNSLKVVSPIAYPVRNPDGSFGSSNTSYENDNPYVLVTNSGYTKQFTSTTQGNLGAKWDLSQLVTPGLSLQGRFAYDRYYYNSVSRIKRPIRKQYQGINPDNGEDMYTLIGEEQAMGYAMGQNANRAYYFEVSAHYDHSFGKHNVSALVLANWRDYKNLTAGNSILNIPYRRQGVAGRISYDYDHRYLVEVDAGYNGSENFPKGQRYGFFPAVSAGWVLSNESFWNVDVINNLKLRASYGLVGNDEVGGDRFLYLSTIDKNANGNLFGESFNIMPGYREDDIGSPNVSWEVSTKRDVGIDLGLFRGIVDIQVDGFYETRNKILLQRKIIPDIMGTAWGNTPYANLGIVKNWGADGQIQVHHTTAKGFYYSFNINATFARNKIVEDDTAKNKYAYLNTRGTRLGQPFVYVAEGFFQSQEEIDNSPVQTFQSVTHIGDVKYKDINGDNVIDAYDRMPVGYTQTPEIMGGFTAVLAYKGVDLSLQFTGATNVTMFINSHDMLPYELAYPGYNIRTEYYDNRFVLGAADNSKAKYPSVTNGTNPNNYRKSTIYMKDASYLKLKNAEIGYNFPKRLLEKARLEGVRLFVNGMNLLWLDNVKFTDPEQSGTGTYPAQRSINVGAQINF